MDGTMKPPHGLMGLDTSHDFPWIMVIIATMLGVFILCTVYHLYRTKMMNRPQKEKSPTQLIREIKLGMENLKIIESSDYKTHFAQISLNLREALEQFVNLPLRDLTTEEIESRLSAQWPLTKPFGEFIDILRWSDRVKYQNIELASDEFATYKEEALKWVDELLNYGRHSQ